MTTAYLERINYEKKHGAVLSTLCCPSLVWAMVRELLDLRNRGLVIAPKLAIAEGALGFWKAVGEVWPVTQEQACIGLLCL